MPQGLEVHHLEEMGMLLRLHAVEANDSWP
jgi:hypothetical protein